MKTPTILTNHNQIFTLEKTQALFALSNTIGEKILEIYHDKSHWEARQKPDNSVVTAADLISSKLLVSQLPSIVPCPVVSEEEIPPYSTRQQWSLYWLVDPLDGTRHFLSKTGEFVINIALMQENQPIFGFIYQPTTQLAWWGSKHIGVFQGTSNTNKQKITRAPSTKNITVLSSQSACSEGDWRTILLKQGYRISTRSMGSALKFTELLTGKAHLYPRLGPTSEWDTAAPQALIEAIGGQLITLDGKRLTYGKENTLNPFFLASYDSKLLDLIVQYSN